jgi:hypothetical protein
MDSKEVSHKSDVSHVEIYERLVKVEEKVDKVAKDTEGMVHAFTAASGAFTVLEWIAKLAKPIIWTVGSIAAIVIFIQDYRSH